MSPRRAKTLYFVTTTAIACLLASSAGTTGWVAACAIALGARPLFAFIWYAGVLDALDKSERTLDAILMGLAGNDDHPDRP